MKWRLIFMVVFLIQLACHVMVYKSSGMASDFAWALVFGVGLLYQGWRYMVEVGVK